ncbi:unnamed protein product, partial [Symbiodinium microadriaticum]
MGRGRGANRSDGGQGFHVWRGAWSPSQNAPWKSNPPRQQPGAIPGYMSVQLDSEAAAYSQSGVAAGPSMDGDAQLVPTVQSALNQTRKAEGKVQKLKSSLAQRQAKFKEWEVKMMTGYQRERARYAKDTERLQREIQEAEQEQAEARSALRAMAFTSLGGDRERDVEMPPVENVFAAWAQAEECGNMDVLHRALSAEVTPPRTSTAAPRSPPMGFGPAPGLGPPVLPAAMDPYMLSGTPRRFSGLAVDARIGQEPVPPNAPPTAPPSLREEASGYGTFRRSWESPYRDAGATLEEAQAALARGQRIRIIEDDGDEVGDELDMAGSVAPTEVPAWLHFCIVQLEAFFIALQVQAESLCEAYGPEVFGDLPGLVAHLQPSENAVSATLGESVTSTRDVTPAQSSVPPPQNLSSEAGLDASEVETSGLGVALDVPAFVAAAGYRIASCSVGVAFPSSVESIENQVRTHVADLLEESGDQLAPVYPQVVPGVAAFVSYPPWFSEAGLVTAFLDARAIRGHAFAIVPSFPTSAEEIRRAAGFSSVMAHDIFVSGHPSPLRPGAPVELQAGALIRLLPVGSKPLWAAPLAFALWHPHYWPSGVLVPRTREAACALVLHSSGKYLYDRFCSDDWANQNGIAALVGVSLADVRMQAADPQEMLPYVYRGSPVRGVLAVVERGHGRDAQDRALPYLVFLDSRPLGFDLNFVVCDSTTLTIEWLLQYLQQPPPAGWKLVVKGGQRHGRMIDFLPGEVLILAFHRCDYEGEEQYESEQGFSPDPEQDDDQSPDEGHRSDSSTRSRSRGHESAPRSRSADHSYQGLQTPPEGGVANRCIHRKGEVQGHEKVATRGHSRAPDINVHVDALSCILGSLAQLGAPICTLRVPDFAGICLRMCGGANETGQGQPFPPDPRDLGDRSPRRPNPPNFRAAPPELAPAAVQATVRARFVLLIEGYRPETVPLTLPVPCDIACAMQELQTYRMPDVRRLFPRLLPVPHQPATGFAVFLATPRWPKSEVEVVLDCRTFSGLLHTACLPPVANLALLRARAGIAWWRNAEVWIEPYTRPVPENEVFRLFPGSVVVFLTANAPAPQMTDLTTMLRSTDCWDHLEPLPFIYDPALWVVTDEGAFRFAVEGNRPRRFVLAHALEYDPSRLVVIGPEPPIRNFCDQGASTDAVIVASQNVPINRASDTGLCVVVIDQRPILLGVTWKVVTNGLFSMGRYAAEIPRRCPAGYQLAFSGAFPLFGTDLLRVADATCLTVEFVAVRPLPQDGADDNSDSGPTVHTLHSNDEGSSSYDSDSDSSGSGPPAGPPPPRPLTSPGQPHWCAQMIALLGTCAVPAAAESLLTAQPASSADPSWLFAIIHFWMLGFLCRIVSSFLGRYLEAISCKSADDPSFGHGSHWALESLSVATRLLQIPPCAMPRDLARLLCSGELVEGLVEFEPIDVAVTFVILKPAYSPEFVTLVLQLPCTWGEVEALLLDARVTAMCVRFPFVWPVAHQHIPGFAVLLAAPRWDPHAVVVCLNSAAFDGRVYAAYAPPYIDHDGLCWLASMPSGIDFDVFVDGDDQPLARGPEVHLAQGMQIVYVEAGQVPTAGHALHQLLLTPAFWEGDASFPIADAPAAFGGRVFLEPGAVMTVDFVPVMSPIDAVAPGPAPATTESNSDELDDAT